MMAATFNATFKESNNLTATFNVQIVASDKPTYGGTYEVTPSAHEAQILETAGTIMEDDVTVKIIPFFQTSNVSGDTVYIASEV